MNLEQGDLTVIIVEAKLTRDIETFSKMDPLVKVEWENSNGQKKSFETKQLDEAGTNPFWGTDPASHNSFGLFVNDF